jgi:hypothetical protein
VGKWHGDSWAEPVYGAFDSIATVTVGAGGSSLITFSSIPQTYKHLQIRSIARNNTGSGNQDTQAAMRFNSDSGANYTYHLVGGNNVSIYAGGGTGATNATAGIVAGGGAPANCFAVGICDILDYTDANKYKVVRLSSGDEYNNSNSNLYYWSNLWLNTSAITRIDITNSNNYAQYSQFALYGIVG